MADASSPTLNELLEFIKDFAVQQYRERACATHGSILADAIRRRFPEFSYEQVGLTRLADAVSSAEERGFVVRDRGVAHLEIVPGPVTCVNVTASSTARPQFLRPEVWRALVFVTANERHFMDRHTGRVRSVSAEDAAAIGTHVADPNSVEIPPIAAATQQSWVREFVRGQADLALDEAPIEEPQWWVRVPEWLRGKGADFERNWRRERSRRVIAAAAEWAGEKGVSERLLFAPQRQRATEPPIEDREADATRQALLAALGDMTLHELESLCIPARYVIRHFRAR